LEPGVCRRGNQNEGRFSIAIKTMLAGGTNAVATQRPSGTLRKASAMTTINTHCMADAISTGTKSWPATTAIGAIGSALSTSIRPMSPRKSNERPAAMTMVSRMARNP
jgi:hypothetical protein